MMSPARNRMVSEYPPGSRCHTPSSYFVLVGYRGKVWAQEQARALRAGGAPLADIAGELGVSIGSVSLWVRDVDAEPRPRRPARRRGPNALQRAKQAQIDDLRARGRDR